MLKKNEIITIEITGMTGEGNGVGRHEGMAVFVPLTARGDVISCRIVKVLKSYLFGKIEKIITPSPCRKVPECEVFGRCGGCAFQHFSYDEELKIKQSFVRDSFERIGHISTDFEPILGAERTERYRNKAQYPVAERGGKVICGFYSRRTHEVIPQTDCLLQPKSFAEIVDEILKFANENKISAYDEVTHRGLLRHIYIRRGEHSGEIMVCLVVTSISNAMIFEPFAKNLAKKFQNIGSVILNENSKPTNVILGRKTKFIFGNAVIADIMCGRKIEISPLSFYQVNTLQAEKLYEIAANFAGLSGNELLLDLYCGAGTIGLSMAGKVKKLIGVEIISDAVENARKNASLNGIENAEFICGDAGKITEILYGRGERPDVIIADPARKGCSPDALNFMVKMEPQKIVMISCNHATAARDCAILEEKGYKVERVRAVDLFPRTGHVETVVLMSRVRD